MKTFAMRLRQTREAQSISQSDLASKCGLQPSAISHFETGRREPNIANLARLAGALRKSTDWLLGIAGSFGIYGPDAQQLLVAFGKMSSADQDAFMKFAFLLAAKPNGKNGRS